MAIEITGVKRGASTTVRPGKHGNVIEWEEHYTVQTTNIEYSEATVIQTAVTTLATTTYLPGGGLPIPQVTVSTDGYAVCSGLSGERLENNPRVWHFHATWSGEVQEANSSATNISDVTTIIPVRKTLFEPIRRYRIRDYGGQPYVNGAGNLFNPAMEVEEEISRWEFSQFEPVHSGVGAGIVTKTEPTVVTASGSAKVRPPGIYQDSTLALLIGVTDDTIHYFNGSINSHYFRFKAPYTLKLNVRDSYTTKAYGLNCRITEYTITYDPTRWFDKPVNSGPWFLAPRLDATGTPVPFAPLVPYEYIYYTANQETQDTILSQDEAGPLGYFAGSPGPYGDVRFYGDATSPTGGGGTAVPITFDSTISSSTNPFIWTRQLTDADGMPMGNYILVDTANGNKTYRAIRPDPAVNTRRFFIERLNHFVFDFGDYLRVR